MNKSNLFSGLLVVLLILLAACGSKAATMADIPAYPAATALEPGADPVADTWENGLGGIAGGVMDSVNQGNDLFQTGTWSRNKQTLSLIRVAETTESDGSFLLIMSLATN